MSIVMGRNQQINCPESEFYKFLGYLTNHPNDVRIVWENNKNQGAWDDEGRIQFLSPNVKTLFPIGFKFTAGVGNNIDSRINCNELFTYMTQQLGFISGTQQNLIAIRNNIPSQYQADFDIGTQL